MNLSKQEIKRKIQAVDSDNHVVSLPSKYGDGLSVTVRKYIYQGAEFKIAYSPKNRIFWAEARMGDNIKEVSPYKVDGLDKVALLQSEEIINL